MKIVFVDRQDSANAWNGTTLHDAAAAREIVERHKNRQPFFAELIGDHGYKLLLGLGSAEGCAQFSPSDGSAPYFMAMGDSPEDEGELDFLIADSASPVPKRFLLNMDAVSEIAAGFVSTGGRSSLVSWEEI